MKTEMQESSGENRELILFLQISQDFAITTSCPKKQFFWAFNIGSNFCVLQERKTYQVPEDEDRHIQHIHYTSPQAFNLPCHSSNHSQMSCLCGSRQQGNYLFMHFISTILSLTNPSFCFFSTNCCLLSQRSPTLLSKTLLRCILNLSN